LIKDISYELALSICPSCLLVQTEETVDKTDIFHSEYTYFSSVSKSWLKQCEEYVNKIKSDLPDNPIVYELASNDGYLQDIFKKNNINCVGIEPTASTADVAKQNGHKVIIDFMSCNLINNLDIKNTADLIVANNVIAHVPNITDFVKAIYLLLKNDGFCTIEFPSLMNLIKYNQYDTIYIEHYMYFSLHSMENILECAGLHIWKVEELPLHGGSYRVYAEKGKREKDNSYYKIIKEEKEFGIENFNMYDKIQNQFMEHKAKCLKWFCNNYKDKTVCFGAAAKGISFLNYLGIDKSFISYMVDDTPQKQNKVAPKCRIPIYNTEVLYSDKDVKNIIILPWNFKNEIMEKLKNKNIKATIITMIPNLEEINSQIPTTKIEGMEENH
jgi:SAM-dependent methyltransferase